MGNDYYSEGNYLRFKKKRTLYLVLSLSLIAFGLLFLGLSAFWISPATVNVIILVDSLVVSLSFVSASFFILEGVLPAKRRINFLYHILTVDRYQGLLKVIKVSKPHLVRKNIIAYEVELEDEEGKKMTCFLEEEQGNGLEEGKNYIITIASSFIVSIEEGNPE